MGNGLLSSLRKYRPREGHDPLENFITEAFAWILRKHPDFSVFFFGNFRRDRQKIGLILIKKKASGIRNVASTAFFLTWCIFRKKKQLFSSIKPGVPFMKTSSITIEIMLKAILQIGRCRIRRGSQDGGVVVEPDDASNNAPAGEWISLASPLTW
ncbi:MAG: hypothetical protein AAF685_09415, partial [Cyanobacteria bacterium P01_C01_bin.89]